MFGNKLRSWMEAVRPKRKQHRKDKQNKLKVSIDIPQTSQIQVAFKTEPCLGQITPKLSESIETELSSNGPLQSEGTCSRYSVANLSSPESAYSTGYSTDGTSPGVPSDYYSKVKTKLVEKLPVAQCDTMNPSIQQTTQKISSPLPENKRPILNTAVEIASPRQRNRIRTNPWLPTSTNATPKQCSSLFTSEIAERRLFSSSNQCVAASPMSRRKSLQSSSCSSLSGAETYWEGSEDDCTLNEMMGKYDESYVYEKETDILSDSDPTDFDTDMDTGQDGGDELEPQEGDMYYIDDGSLTETNPGEQKNTGHCSYFNFQEKRKVSRRKTARRLRQKSSSRKKKVSSMHYPENLHYNSNRSDGSRSVGATPLFSRRTHQLPISKLAMDEKLTRRSVSTHLYHDRINTIDKKDEEADQKYEELIVEAEHILRNIKTEGLSPRRLPGPANKRVELLRSAECPKMARISDVPSTNITSFRHISRPTLPTVGVPTSLKSPVLYRKPSERQPHYRSPKHKKKATKARKEVLTSSSDDEGPRLRAPPQSEPLKRKVYSSSGKNVVLCPNNCNAILQRHRNSAESLRHQVLINTISNLKKSLENQSASLKQAYRSPVHCPPCL